MSKDAPICLCGNPAGHTGNVYHPAPGEPVDPKRILEQGSRATVKPRSVEFSAVVIRCGCGKGKAGHPVLPDGSAPCPTPRQVEDRGIVAAYYRNPFKRLGRWLARSGGKVSWQL